MATATATTICRTLPTAVLTLAVYEKPALAATLAHRVAAAEAAGAMVAAVPAPAFSDAGACPAAAPVPLAQAEAGPSGTINTTASATTNGRIGRIRSPPRHHTNLL